MIQSDAFFKGWAKPGPIAPGAARGDAPEAGETLDAISGYFRLFQYADGHRFSTDDLLAAWYGTTWCPSARTALDLGSGIGTVGMIAAWRLPGARFVTVEAQDISVKLARKSAHYNGIEERYDIRQGDFRDAGVLAPDERFDLITGSPPYFPLGTGILGDHPQKIACRFEVRGDVSDYCAVTARHLALGGVFAGVMPANMRDRVEKGARDAGLSLVRGREVIAREGEPPLLWVFLLMRATDLPEKYRADTWNEPPLTIRCKDGSVHPEYRAVKLAIGFPP